MQMEPMSPEKSLEVQFIEAEMCCGPATLKAVVTAVILSVSPSSLFVFMISSGRY
jgi:hypothetical protein